MDRQRIFIFRLLLPGLVITGLFGTNPHVAQSAEPASSDGSAIAEALLEYGRANNDPESIIAAVGIFAKSDSGTGARNLSGLLSEAMALRPDDEMLVAFAGRVADDPHANDSVSHDDAEDDDEKTRQAPAFLQQRTVAAPAAKSDATGDSKGGEKDDTKRDATGAATPTAPIVIPAYQHTFIEIALAIGLLVFGGVLVGLQVLLMITQRKYWDDWAIKVTGLTLVITCGLLLIVAGYSEEQSAPMMGMLGTVAGYLLGKEGGS